MKIKLNVYRLCWFCVLQAMVACALAAFSPGAVTGVIG